MNKCIKLLAKKKLSITFLESASAGYLAYRFSCAAASGVRDEGMAPRYRLAGAGSKPP